MQKSWIAAASFLLAFAVAMGALGAHALREVCTVEQINSFETAVRYQVWHCFAILFIQFLPDPVIGKKRRVQITLSFLIGIIAFSFSIYLLALRDVLGIQAAASILGPITPIGGLFLIGGWIWLGISVLFFSPKNGRANAGLN